LQDYWRQLSANSSIVACGTANPTSFLRSVVGCASLLSATAIFWRLAILGPRSIVSNTAIGQIACFQAPPSGKHVPAPVMRFGFPRPLYPQVTPYRATFPSIVLRVGGRSVAQSLGVNFPRNFGASEAARSARSAADCGRQADERQRSFDTMQTRSPCMTQIERSSLKTSIERHMAAPRAATAHGEGNLPANGTLAREKPLRSTMECETYAPAAHTTEHGSRTLARMSQMIDRHSSDPPQNECPVPRHPEKEADPGQRVSA